ncbi:MAG: MMPL family transporter, partial [Actinobacteria bacterium]|nr:MMPL family transporter [Actinomycetota bacterium]
MFARLGPWCHDKRRLVLVLWILLLIGANALSGSIGDNYRQDFKLPGAESSAGFDVLNDKFGGQGAGQAGTIVFKADRGVNDQQVKAAMSEMFDKVAKIKGISRVESPYAPGGERFVSAQGPGAGKVAYANVEFPEDTDFAQVPAITDKVEAAAPKIDGLQVELGGNIFATFEPPTSEIIGLAFAIVILILAFGSVLAMGLPIAVALTGIGIGSALVILFSHIVQVPEFAPFIGVMIGLGVGIDYALLIVTRYREQLHANHTVRESVQIAIDTAGRSVLFAGITVVISLLGMLLMGVGFVQGLAVSAAATVAVTVLASLTLLPALLGFAGPGIEKRRRAGLIAAGLVALGLMGVGFNFKPLLAAFGLAVVVVLAGFFVPALKREVEHRPAKPRRETLAYRWSRGIQHRPWLAAIASAVVLLILAVPVLNLRLAFSDESNYPQDTSTKKAYDLLVDGFGKGYNGPILLVTSGSGAVDPAALGAVRAAVAQDPNVVFVSDPIPNNPQSPTAVLWNVVPNSGPQDEATTQLVSRLRKTVLPPVESQVGTQIAVTGITAANNDFAHVLSSRMPYFFLAVLALSFLLLMAVFRSLLVPLKAVIMNLLS